MKTRHIEKKTISVTSLNAQIWTPHTNQECATCQNRGKKRKEKPIVPEDNLPLEITLGVLRESSNPQLIMCICSLCKGIQGFHSFFSTKFPDFLALKFPDFFKIKVPQL